MRGDSKAKAVKTINPKTGKLEYRRYHLNYWGHAQTIIQTKPKHFVLKKATFTTCPPVKSVWHLSASTVNLDKKKQIGSAWNAALFVKKMPVFYFPYISFPLTHERETGFLSPSYGVTKNSGFHLNLPFYWNIAPNYDDLITPSYLSDRGMMFYNLFRYLTPSNSGRIHMSFLPNDRAFKQFKVKAKNRPQYASQPQGLKALRQDSDNRYSLHWKNSAQYNNHWSSSLDYNLVSDDYYVEDLSNNLLNNSQSQLLQQADMDYQNQHWNLRGLLQNYQTLHPVNFGTVENQYARLPEFQADMQYALGQSLWQFNMATDAVNFYKERTPDTLGPKPVIGQRVYLTPDLSASIYRPYGHLTTHLEMQLTQYHLRQAYSIPSNSSEALPIFNVSGGLVFLRPFAFLKKDYLETFEPHFYYLFVPYHNQNNLPIFDTTTQAFNYNTMFQSNRFVGIDRIGDANQVTLALTSRFIDEQTGNEKGEVSIAEIYYFHARRVNLCSGKTCSDNASTLDRRVLSPIAATGAYYFTPAWSLTGDLSWDPNQSRFTYQDVGASYHPKPNNVLNLSYSLVQTGTALPGQPQGSPNLPLKQINLSGAWALTKHWDALGQYSYSWGRSAINSDVGSSNTNDQGRAVGDHINAFLAGFEYNSCCWALRLVGARNYQGITNKNKSGYNNAVFVQVELKGLGAVGTDDPGGLLESSISGYQDHFGQVGNEKIVI